ncbi:hypothetical protein DU508_17050 [Pedobacter chinensis]|uniref:Uncharacterized protein n=1 Tax=Pedobacter chinensis TaxID=2282421 RepID=A0A369PSJ7_9SPHI|nr:hypothetical protein DU508_17050 [Pedobacter chinensis]
MVRLSNQFLEDSEKLANIYKRYNTQLTAGFDVNHNKVKANATMKMPEQFISVDRREGLLRKTP